MTELRRDIADCMADVIVAQMTARGEYSKDDLLKAGYTLDEINRYEPLAYGYASVQLHNQRRRNVS
ncbi:MAG: hypothetical protein KGI97_00820 [Alphaproteobacteria bacterium]|nr:hypothetical protein [Alphaproteobacteria bacterium]